MEAEYSCKAGSSGQVTFPFDLADGEVIAGVVEIRMLSDYVTLSQFWKAGNSLAVWIRNDTTTDVGKRTARCTALVMGS